MADKAKAQTKTKVENKPKTKTEPKSKTEVEAKPTFRRKCKLCGKYITDENDAIAYKNGYVHANCFAASVNAVQTQRAEKEEKKVVEQQAKKPGTREYKIPKKGLSEEEYAAKLDFFNTVKAILKVQQLPAKVYAMADHLMEKYKIFTYPGMKETLLYCQRTQGKQLTDDCMGLIPYYYDEAMAEAERVKQAQHNAEATLSRMTTEAEIISIPKPSAHNNKIINIEEIG